MRQNTINKNRRSENEMKGIEDEQNSKYLFPKLKSYSHNGRSSLSFVELKGSVKSRLLCQDPSNNHHQRSLSRSKEENNRPVMIKYQYVSKSPSYFKKLSKSIQQGSNNIQGNSGLIDSSEKTLIKPQLVNLIQSRVNNSFMKDSVGNSSTNNNARGKSQKIQTMKEGPNTKNSLTKSKAQYDKIRAFILLEKYSKNIGDEKKEFYIPSKENEQKKASLSPLQYSNGSLYETKYSHFSANSLLPLKSQLKTPKNNFSQKLDFYRFQ